MGLKKKKKPCETRRTKVRMKAASSKRWSIMGSINLANFKFGVVVVKTLSNLNTVLITVV